ncbi:carboxypeptidase regulatory-like domain-containing protein [Candidatus Woesebacteria bacterium]|nr:carboxypeptidase regulatory-like domain-containing protein [Candidatus Woesebacteria bacterium]
MFRSVRKLSYILSFACLFGLSALFFYWHYTRADGTYANIGTATGTNGGYDAVSWSQGYPIMIDSYGKFIVPVQHHTLGNRFAYSNDDGATWSETTTGGDLTNRPAAVYDSINDKIHVLIGDTNGATYKRFVINRDKNYDIVSITLDSTLTPFDLDDDASCTSGNFANPVLLWKNTGSNGTLVAFWSTLKSDCGGSSVTATRASMRTLSNTSADGTAGNWASLDGSTDSGATDPANVAFDELYTYAGAHSHEFQHAALIRGGSGAAAEDIYYFTSDESDTNGYRRLAWSSGSSNWSGAWTARSEFGGDVTNSSGYSLKHELLSKPVYASGHGKVYIGIARYLSGGLGDTQSLYSVDESDTVTLESNVYSASGTHCLYPTFDLMYDATDDELYFFYIITGDSSVCGHTYYKTFDNTDWSSAVPYYTVANRSVDIPVTYPSRYKDKVHLFYRLNSASDASTPPHEIHYGTVALSDTTTEPSVSAGTSPYTASSYADFTQTCRSLSSTEAMNTSGGEFGLESTIRDDFENPTDPYSMVWKDFWSLGTWSGGTFNPTPDGTVLVYNSGGGAYMLGQSTATQRSLEFRAQFTAHNFQHVGWVPDENFAQYIMFSTHNNGQLNARFNSGGGETIENLGTSYLGAYHTYRIDWGASNVVFYIDGTSVATVGSTSGTAMTPIISNNTTTAGSNLSVDWLRIKNYPSTTGTYRYCSLDGGAANTYWDGVTYTATTSGGTANYQTRTSANNESWSDWSSTQTSGTSVLSSAARYLQILFNLSGSSTETPTVNNFSITFEQAPAAASSLAQYRTDASTSISTGGSTTDTTLVFKFDMSDGDSSETLTPEIEVQQVGTDFTTVPTATGSGVAYSGSAVQGSVTVSSDLSVGTSYHWQARTCDENQCSAWTSYGGNAESAADFSIVAASSGSSDSSSTSSSSSSSTSSQPPGCSQASPGSKVPLLYSAIAEDSDKVRLYFAPGDAPYDYFALSFGRSSGSNEFGSPNLGGANLRSYLVTNLQANTEYFFRIRNGHGCAPGEWSNKISVKTLGNFRANTLLLTTEQLSKPSSSPVPELNPVATPSGSLDTEAVPSNQDLTIFVKNPDGAAVAGASVELHSEPRYTTTDEEGRATFTDVESGEHTLKIAYDNYVGEQKLFLDGNKPDVEIVVTLRKEGVSKDTYILGGAIVAAGLFLSIALLWISSRKNQK